MADWFTANAPAQQGDWFSLNAPPQALGDPVNAPGTPDLASFGEQGAQYAPNALTPQDEAQLATQFGQEHPLLSNAAGALIDTAKGLPSFAAKLPEYAYEGLKVASGNESPADAAMRAWAEAQPQGQAMAQGLQSPPGSREFDAAALQAAMMAAPGLELFKGAHPEIAAEAPIEKPPVQPETPPAWASDPVVAPASGTASVQSVPEQAAKDTGARPVSAIDLSDPSTPITERGPTLALKLDDGTVVYDSSSRLHSQVLDKAGVEPTRVVDSGIYKPISKEFVSKTPDTVEIFPKSKPETIAEKAARLGWEKNPNSIGQRLVPDTGPKPAPQESLQPEQPSVTIPPEDVKYAGTSPEFQARNAQAGQSDTAPVESASVGSPEPDRIGAPERPGSGTSNRAFEETYGDESVPGGAGVDTTQLLDNARADIRSGAADPYGILSRTRAKGIANAEEYATLAAEHERLVNDAVAKQKANAPDAPQAAKAAEDFANAIQPHKTAASDLMRLFQGDVNYDMSTPFGMDQYMKSEIGRTATAAERPKFNRMSNDIGRAQTEVQQAVARSDARVQSRYAKVRDIPMEEAASRVRDWLKDCIV